MAQTVPVRILFFAQAREQTKQTEGNIDFPRKAYKAREILESILETFPELKPLEQCVILAKNQNYLDFNSEELVDLRANDEIAVKYISYLHKSFNMDHIKLVSNKIDTEEIIRLATSPKCGAISTFIGITRDNFEDKMVVQLEYEAYEPMAINEMKKVCTIVREKWSVENIVIYHRLGLVPVSEASVFIAISSAHRRESLEAVNFAIDALKESVPIWKKEVYDTSSNVTDTPESAWKANAECFWSQNNKPGAVRTKGCESKEDN